MTDTFEGQLAHENVLKRIAEIQNHFNLELTSRGGGVNEHGEEVHWVSYRSKS